MNTPSLIVIEGLDATGKTTLANVLGERLGAVVLSTPPTSLKLERAGVDSVYANDGLALQLFYASTVSHVSREAARAMANWRTVILDRYWLSTLVYNSLRPGSVVLDVVEEQLLVATVTVLLDTSEDERLRRLEVRGASPADRSSMPYADKLRRLYREALNRSIAGIPLELDTTTLSPADCAEAVINFLGEVAQ